MAEQWVQILCFVWLQTVQVSYDRMFIFEKLLLYVLWIAVFSILAFERGYKNVRLLFKSRFVVCKSTLKVLLALFLRKTSIWCGLLVACAENR